MPRKPGQVQRKRPIVRDRRGSSGDSLILALGPPLRAYYRFDWPDEERRLLEAWNRDRSAVMAETTPLRPWGYFWFDRPHADTIPGPRRDDLLAAGRLDPAEAAMMGRAHTAAALSRVAASRPDKAIADWLADPDLIEDAVTLVGWNPFTEEVIAYLRAAYRPKLQETP